MKLILLSGGSGSRLWPLSNPALPKQFLKVLPASDESAPPVSMIQRIWWQLDAAGLTQQTVIPTSRFQEELIHSQLPLSAEVVFEPSCRDTYPAIVLACLYLFSRKKAAYDETVIIMPVDTYVSLDFFDHLKSLKNILNSSSASLALVGISPTAPDEKYGYIIPDHAISPAQPYRKVSHFKEKPSAAAAASLITQGALWNSGVFAFKLGFLLDLIRSEQLPLSYDYVLTHYETLPKISFDFKVAEKTSNMVVMHYNGSWKDLGTWSSLMEEMSPSMTANGLISSDCKNVRILNETQIPISVLGLSDLIVVATPEGILITSQKASSRVKEIT